jgi:hypothetical protein
MHNFFSIIESIYRLCICIMYILPRPGISRVFLRKWSPPPFFFSKKNRNTGYPVYFKKCSDNMYAFYVCTYRYYILLWSTMSYYAYYDLWHFSMHSSKSTCTIAMYIFFNPVFNLIAIFYRLCNSIDKYYHNIM